jgi:hypothetical protein
MNVLSLSLAIACMIAFAMPANAAVSCAVLTSGSDATNRVGTDPYVTASVTPTANALVLVAVVAPYRSDTTAGNYTVTLTGNGLTYVQIDKQAISTAGSPSHLLSLFRSMGASPSAGTISITWAAADGSLSGSWIVAECTGVDTSGTNGSGAIVQSDKDVNVGGTSLALSLAAFGSANNATFATFSLNANLAVTNEGGWTELADVALDDGTNDSAIQAQWIASNDTSPSASWSAADSGGIAIEIKAAVSGRRPIAPVLLQ